MSTVLIASGYELFRMSLRRVLEGSGRFSTVTESSSVTDLLEKTSTTREPALAIIDPGSLGMRPADLLSLARRLMPNSRLVIFAEEKLALPADGAGHPVTVLRRDARLAEVEEVISDMVLGANGAGTPADGRAQADRADGMRIAQPSRSPALSPRQEEIMAMMAEGMANKEIAHRLGIAEGTVKAHIHAIFRALGVSNRTQAVVRFSGRWPRSGAA